MHEYYATELLAVVLVAVLWGATNPFIKRYSAQPSTTRSAPGSGLLTWLQSPLFVTAQLLNQAGSLLFAVLLGTGDISKVVPAANAGALAVNALVDVALGERYHALLLLPGVVLIGCGMLLCGSA